MSSDVPVGVTVHQPVRDWLAEHCGQEMVESICASIEEELETAPDADHQERNPDEPGEFFYPILGQASGTWRFWWLAVADGWEQNHLHVVGIEQEVGGGALLPQEYGPLE